MSQLTVDRTEQLLQLPYFLNELTRYGTIQNPKVLKINSDLYIKSIDGSLLNIMKDDKLQQFRMQLLSFDKLENSKDYNEVKGMTIHNGHNVDYVHVYNNYVFNKIKELERQIKELTNVNKINKSNNVIIVNHDQKYEEISEETISDSSEEVEDEEEVGKIGYKPKTQNMTVAEYKKICEKISSDNQYYHLLFVCKQSTNYPDGQLTVIHNPLSNNPHVQRRSQGQYYQIFSYSLTQGNGVIYKHHKCKNEDMIEIDTLEAIRYQNTLGGSFILFENDIVMIFIKGIKEPNVFAVIDEIKANYELQ